MRGLRAGTRYARALIGQAKEQSSLEAVHKDVLLLQETLKKSNDLLLLLQSPIVKTEKKKTVLEQIFKGKVQDLTLQFLLMMTEKKREGALPIILSSFISQYNEKHGIAVVQVKTATPLSDKNRKEIEEKVKSSYHFNSVQLKETVDERLIGGIVIRIGDKQIDESIRKKLNEIHQELINA